MYIRLFMMCTLYTGATLKYSNGQSDPTGGLMFIQYGYDEYGLWCKHSTQLSITATAILAGHHIITAQSLCMATYRGYLLFYRAGAVDVHRKTAM